MRGPNKHRRQALAAGALWSLSWLVGAGAARATSPALPTDQITHVMKAQFDRPDAPLDVGPVAVEGDHAVAGWTQGERGGRALLQRREGRWEIVVCAGDGLTRAKDLALAGLTPAQADRLARRVQAVERGMALERRKRLASFEGVVRVQGGQHGHPGSSHHTAQPPHAGH